MILTSIPWLNRCYNPRKTAMNLVYIGTLPPHTGGTAVWGFLLLNGLARRGYTISAISPITEQALAQGDPMANASFPVSRYIVPRFETAPNHPASATFRKTEKKGIRSHVRSIFFGQPVDLILCGRETFAWHVPEIAHEQKLPWIQLAHGGTTWGLVDRSFPSDLAESLIHQMRGARQIVAVANHLEARLRELGLTNVMAIPNAVDTEQFVPQIPDPILQKSLGIGSHHVVVSHISNMKMLKRPLDIIHAAKIALKQNDSLLYLMIGTGDYFDSMKTECQRLGLQDYFRFTGWIPHSEVCRYINLSDMIVMTSTREARALVYLETLACGKVLITTDIAAASEMVEDRKNGLLFPVGDVPRLAELILQASHDPELRKTLGRNARKSALQWPLSTALDQYEALFHSVK